MTTKPLNLDENRSRLLFRLISYIRVAPNGCWIWTGARNRENGYGQLGDQGKVLYVHRLTFELFRGPIPPGTVLDHCCAAPGCCNPFHLEAVTPTENYQRWRDSLSATTHPCGHPAHAANTIKGRCRCCVQDAAYRYRLDVLQTEITKTLVNLSVLSGNLAAVLPIAGGEGEVLADPELPKYLKQAVEELSKHPKLLKKAEKAVLKTEGLDDVDDARQLILVLTALGFQADAGKAAASKKLGAPQSGNGMSHSTNGKAHP